MQGCAVLGKGVCLTSRRDWEWVSDKAPQALGPSLLFSPSIARCKRTVGAAPSLTERNGEFLAVNSEWDEWYVTGVILTGLSRITSLRWAQHTHNCVTYSVFFYSIHYQCGCGLFAPMSGKNFLRSNQMTKPKKVYSPFFCLGHGCTKQFLGQLAYFSAKIETYSRRTGNRCRQERVESPVSRACCY